MRLRDAFRHQAQSCGRLGSPFMERMLSGLADAWPETGTLAARCTDWPGELGPNGASLPLRIAGGLHALVLSGRDPDLARVYPPRDVTDAGLIAEVLAALDRNEPFLLDWIDRAPQTNEVRRAAAIIPAAHWIAARHPLPIRVSELGASGGLNLMWDRFAIETDAGRLGPADPALTLTPAWSGTMPDAARIEVAGRAGVDLSPLDVRDADDRLRLLSYLWPDQPHRAELTRAAIAAFDAGLDSGDAVDWLKTRLDTAHEGQLHLVYHTIAWQYFPPDRQEKGRALMEAAGARATPDRPLGWLSLEHDGDSASKDGACLSVRLWPGDETVTLARADFHGRWVRWLS